MQGMTLLMWACDGGHTNVVRYLLSNGAQIDATDADGQTALHYACACDRPELVQLLLRHGANPCVQDSEGNAPAAMSSSPAVAACFAGAPNLQAGSSPRKAGSRVFVI
eukprot:m.162916 g.162916  ORF g.162916 m.162916 type:complete len:108 (+) comp21019_c0_seq2:60-383(+)